MRRVMRPLRRTSPTRQLLTAICCWSVSSSCQAPPEAPPSEPQTALSESAPVASTPPSISPPAADASPEDWRRYVRRLRTDSQLGAAEDACDHALALFRDARFQEPGQDLMASEGSVRLANACGSVYGASKRRDEAFELHLQALDGARQIGFRHGEASSLNRLAVVHRYRGENRKALDLNRQALTIFQELEDQPSIAATYHNLGTLLLVTGKVREALDRFEEAEQIRQELGDPYGLGSTWTRIGDVQTALGRRSQALESYQKALGYRQQAGDRRGTAVTRDQLGQLLADLGRTEEALEHTLAAGAIFADTKDSVGRVNNLTNQGWLHLDLGQLEAARKALEQALGWIDQVQDRNAEAHAWAGLGLALRRQGDLEGAREPFEAALETIEAMRAETPAGSLRTSYFAIRQRYFELYIDLLIDLHQRFPNRGLAERAFHASEQARARGLLDGLATGPLELSGDQGSELRQRLEELNAQLATAELERRLEPSAAERPALDQRRRDQRLRDQRLRDLLLEYEHLQREIRAVQAPQASPPARGAARPNTAEWRRASTSLEDIQRLLPEDTLVLRYSLGSERSFLWLVDPHSVEVVEIAGREILETIADELHNLLRASHLLGASGQARRVARILSQEILEPVGERLNAERLVVIADGKLHHVPFAVLPDPRAPQTTLLLDHHEIVHLPSATVLVELSERRARRSPPPRPLAVVAPGFTSTDGTSGPSAGGQAAAGSAPPARATFARPLPSSRQEAEAILELAPAGGNLELLDRAATKHQVLAAELGRYRILHFATHGLVHDHFPELSALVLSAGTDTASGNADFLYLYEIFQMHLPVELVVLSACETALGELVRGEGVVGMSQGFLTAGASRVIVSLWRIDDRATAAFMTEFYRGLFEQALTPAAALSAAQRTLRADPDWKAPKFWAGFVLQGDWR